jgi:hypothetical protein
MNQKLLETLDNISSKILDLIKEKYSNKEGFRVIDDREEMNFGRKKEYFLFEKGRDDFSFIWINNNLWQFRYCNINCSYEGNWKNPVEILNELLFK